MDKKEQELKAKKEELEDLLLNKKNVHAVGYGPKKSSNIFKNLYYRLTNKQSIVCFVTKKEALSELKEEDIIPKSVNGVLTDVEPGQQFKEMSKYKEKYRPIKSGVSMCNFKNTACDSGLRVYKDDEEMALVNEHCARRMDGKIKKGDGFSQPSRLDGGTEDDIVGELYDWYEKDADGDNLMDSALVKLKDEVSMVNETIKKGGYKPEVGEMSVGDKVWKEGRTSGYTTGKVRSKGTTVNVEDGNDNVYKMTDQVVIKGKLLSPGDSSSAIFKGKKPVAQGHAGNDKMSVVTPLKRVLDHFDLSLEPKKKREGYIAWGWVDIDIDSLFEDEYEGVVRTHWGLNLREEPTTSAKTIKNLKKGTRIKLKEKAGEKDGYKWVKVEVI